MSELESPQTVAPAPPPPRTKSRAGSFFLGALTGCAVVFVGFALLAMMFAAFNSDGTELSLGDKVAVVTIEGEIMEARETIDALKKYADNATVKAIVVRINSPGGAIAPSQEI